MKFVIATQELEYLISKCLNVISNKPPIPLLSNFLIEAKNGELIITATDMIVGIRCFTEAKIMQEGSVALPARCLAQLIRELTAANVEITVNENHIAEILADTSKFVLRGMSSQNYPNLPDLKEGIQFTLPQNIFKELLYSTSFAVAREESRQTLTGLNMQIGGGQVFFVGTDGRLLARAHVNVGIDSSLTGSYTFPLKAVEEFAKVLADEGDAKIYLLPEKVGIETSEAIVVSNLLVGDYPDVVRVIPEGAETVISIHRDELMTLLRQISLFMSNPEHAVCFSFTPGELRIRANSMAVGEGDVSMPVNYHGAPLDIAFNPGYLLDVLKHSKQEVVTLGLNDAYNPGVIIDQEEVAAVNANLSPLFVLMPMRMG
jgi:DNA polymerase III subunit beta